jgi:hypothetical protein
VFASPATSKEDENLDCRLAYHFDIKRYTLKHVDDSLLRSPRFNTFKTVKNRASSYQWSRSQKRHKTQEGIRSVVNGVL